MDPAGPTPSSPQVTARMARQARRDTAPELALRRALHAAGLRYRLGYPVPGRPRRTVDIAFTQARIAVFVDGCFWHGCPQHATWPVSNAAWWRDKIEANRSRDIDTDAALAAAGWTVVRVWEHDDPFAGLARVLQALGRGLAVRRAPTDRVGPPRAT